MHMHLYLGLEIKYISYSVVRTEYQTCQRRSYFIRIYSIATYVPEDFDYCTSLFYFVEYYLSPRSDLVITFLAKNCKLYCN